MVFHIADNIISSLGFNTLENINSLLDYKTGIKLIEDKNLWKENFFASKIDDIKLNKLFIEIGSLETFSRFEKLLILSAQDAISKANIDITTSETIFIFSTTKGNIDLLRKPNGNSSEFLNKTAKKVTDYFKNPNEPIVVSNACISGVLALITAQRLISTHNFTNAVIIGGDILSEFVVSGFQSFKSLSNAPCKPFDSQRDGLSLGEGAGTIILSNKNINNSTINILSGASANDCNHISGPSRTGDGLFLSISNALNFSKINSEQIDFISAHGTATHFNDEMEAIAFDRANLTKSHINSLKGYFGHTLGAAGIIESIISIYSLNNNILFSSLGFENSGVSVDLNIINKHKNHILNNVLKVASGFGGCNAAIIFSKNE